MLRSRDGAHRSLARLHCLGDAERRSSSDVGQQEIVRSRRRRRCASGRRARRTSRRGSRAAARLAASCISSASPAPMRHGTRHVLRSSRDGALGPNGSPGGLERGRIVLLERPRPRGLRKAIVERDLEGFHEALHAFPPGGGDGGGDRLRGRRLEVRRRTAGCRRGRASAAVQAHARRPRSRASLAHEAPTKCARSTPSASRTAAASPTRVASAYAIASRGLSLPPLTAMIGERSAGTLRSAHGQGAMPSRPRAGRRTRSRREPAGPRLPSPRSRCGRRPRVRRVRQALSVVRRPQPTRVRLTRPPDRSRGLSVLGGERRDDLGRLRDLVVADQAVRDEADAARVALHARGRRARPGAAGTRPGRAPCR